MSAFIVNTTTMDKVVAAVLSRYQSRTFAGVPVSRETAKAIGKALFQLNADAVNQRYGERDQPPDYKWRHADTSDIQQYKAVQCLSYQCAEGDVPERPLYRELEHLERLMAAEIIRRLPAYERAPWD
jgi:hypothetical protein